MTEQHDKVNARYANKYNTGKPCSKCNKNIVTIQHIWCKECLRKYTKERYERMKLDKTKMYQQKLYMRRWRENNYELCREYWTKANAKRTAAKRAAKQKES